MNLFTYIEENTGHKTKQTKTKQNKTKQNTRTHVRRERERESERNVVDLTRAERGKLPERRHVEFGRPRLGNNERDEHYDRASACIKNLLYNSPNSATCHADMDGFSLGETTLCRP